MSSNKLSFHEEEKALIDIISTYNKNKFHRATKVDMRASIESTQFCGARHLCLIGQPIRMFTKDSISCWVCRKLMHDECGIKYTVTTSTKRPSKGQLLSSSESFRICYDCLGSKTLDELLLSIKRSLTSNSTVSGLETESIWAYKKVLLKQFNIEMLQQTKKELAVSNSSSEKPVHGLGIEQEVLVDYGEFDDEVVFSISQAAPGFPLTNYESSAETTNEKAKTPVIEATSALVEAASPRVIIPQGIAPPINDAATTSPNDYTSVPEETPGKEMTAALLEDALPHAVVSHDTTPPTYEVAISTTKGSPAIPLDILSGEVNIYVDNAATMEGTPPVEAAPMHTKPAVQPQAIPSGDTLSGDDGATTECSSAPEAKITNASVEPMNIPPVEATTCDDALKTVGSPATVSTMTNANEIVQPMDIPPPVEAMHDDDIPATPVETLLATPVETTPVDNTAVDNTAAPVGPSTAEAEVDQPFEAAAISETIEDIPDPGVVSPVSEHFNPDAEFIDLDAKDQSSLSIAALLNDEEEALNSPQPTVRTAFTIVSKVVNDSGTFYGIEFEDCFNLISLNNETPANVLQAVREYESTLTSTQSANTNVEPDVSPTSFLSASSSTQREKRKVTTDSEISLPPVKRRKVAPVADQRRSGRISGSASSVRNRAYESDESNPGARLSKKPKKSSDDSKLYSRRATPPFFSVHLKTLVYPVEDTDSLLNVKHLQDPIQILAHKNISLCSTKAGITLPTKPVWGDKYLYSTVAVENKRNSKVNTQWHYFLGFGHRFLMEAFNEDDGIVYYCGGYITSIDCVRLRFMVAYLVLSSTAKEQLPSKTMQSVLSFPLRLFHISSIIPGTIVPRVVGTILDADLETQGHFFKSVSTLFTVGATFPYPPYTIDDKMKADIKSQSFSYRKKITPTGSSNSSVYVDENAGPSTDFSLAEFYPDMEGGNSSSSVRSTPYGSRFPPSPRGFASENRTPVSISTGNALNFQAPQQTNSSTDRIELDRQLQLVSSNRLEVEREQLKVFTDRMMLQIEKKQAAAEAELELKRQEIILLRRNDAPSVEFIKLQEDYAALESRIESITASCKLEVQGIRQFYQDSLTAMLVAQEKSHLEAMSNASKQSLEATTLVVDGNSKALVEFGATISQRMKKEAHTVRAAYQEVAKGIQHSAEVSDRNSVALVGGLQQIAGAVQAGFERLSNQAEAMERNRIQQAQEMEQQRIQDEKTRRDEMRIMYSNSNATIQSFSQSVMLCNEQVKRSEEYTHKLYSETARLTNQVDGAVQVISSLQIPLRLGNQRTAVYEYGVQGSATGLPALHQGDNLDYSIGPRFAVAPPPPQYFNNPPRRLPAGGSPQLPIIPPPQQQQVSPVSRPQEYQRYEEQQSDRRQSSAPTRSSLEFGQSLYPASSPPPSAGLGDLTDDQIRAILQANPELLQSFMKAGRR